MSTREGSSRLPFWVAAALFFLSGSGALIVETSWLRWFRGALGATAPAVSATLVAFFAGQVLGALLGARLAARTRRPLASYAALEAIAALACLAVPVFLASTMSGVDRFYDDGRASLGALSAARFAAAMLASLPASMAFGATFPVLAAAATDRARHMGQTAGGLYAINTAGAALGASLATFLLPALVGISGTHIVGVSCLVAAAISAWLAEQRFPPASPIEAPDRRVGARPGSRAGAIAFASGFGVFAAQVLLTQAFSRVLNQSSFAFGAVLVTTLVSLALGAALVTRFGQRRPARTLAWMALGAAFGFAVLPGVFVAGTDGLSYLGSDRAYPAYLFAAFGLAALTAGPALLAAAGVWPALLAQVGAANDGDGRAAGSLTGRLLAMNTIGAIVGALVAPWILLPRLGLWGAFTAVAGSYAVIAVIVEAPGRALRGGVILAGAIGIALGAPPTALPVLRLEPGDRLLASSSSAAGLVAVIERDGGRLIQTDNHYALGGTADTVHQERQGHLPLILHGHAKRALFLGSATGSSAAAALSHDVAELVLVEIVPGVAASAARWFDASNRGVHGDPRTRVVLDDARSYVRAGRESFDVIVADLFVPWRAGTGGLYTREHFEAIQRRLAPGGLFCQWLPLYQLSEAELQSILTTFADVFPEGVAFRGDFFGSHPILALVGGRELRIDASATSRAAARLSTRGVADRWVTHPFGPWALYAGPLAGVAALWNETPRNLDDHPTVELLAARQHAGSGRGGVRPFIGTALTQLSKTLRESADALGAEPIRGFGPAERRAAEGGHALQTASALWVSGRERPASSALEAAADLLPPELLARAPADPTVAEVWHDHAID